MSNLYAGIAYPFSDTLASYFDPKDDKYVFESSIMNIFFTRQGERVMRGSFGSGIQDEVFEPLDAATGGVLTRIGTTDVEYWDDRLEVVSSEVVPDSARNSISLKVVYRYKKDPTTESTVTIPLAT